MDDLIDENTISNGSMDPNNKSDFEVEKFIRQATEKEFFGFMAQEFGDEVFEIAFKAMESNR